MKLAIIVAFLALASILACSANALRLQTPDRELEQEMFSPDSQNDGDRDKRFLFPFLFKRLFENFEK